MSVRLQINLNKTEADALAHLAASELRDPRDQIRLIVRQELQRRGFFPPAEQGDAPAHAGQSVMEVHNGDTK